MYGPFRLPKKFRTQADSCPSEEANHFDHKVLEENNLSYFIEDRPARLKKKQLSFYLLLYFAMNLITKLQVEEAHEKPGLYMIGSLWQTSYSQFTGRIVTTQWQR